MTRAEIRPDLAAEHYRATLRHGPDVREFARVTLDEAAADLVRATSSEPAVSGNPEGK